MTTTLSDVYVYCFLYISLFCVSSSHVWALFLNTLSFKIPRGKRQVMVDRPHISRNSMWLPRNSFNISIAGFAIQKSFPLSGSSVHGWHVYSKEKQKSLLLCKYCHMTFLFAEQVFSDILGQHNIFSQIFSTDLSKCFLSFTHPM